MTPGPVGLTRAEQAAEEAPAAPRVVVHAQPGARKCRASVPPSGDSCPAAATRVVVWPDGDRTETCAECAGRLAQQALSHKSSVRVELLAERP